LVKDIMDEIASIQSRAGGALPGGGGAGARGDGEEVTRQREGGGEGRGAESGAEHEGLNRPVTGRKHNNTARRHKSLVAADTALRTTDPTQLFNTFKAYAEARMAELEGELDMLHQLRDALDQAQKAFQQLDDQAKQALHTYDSAARAQQLIQTANLDFF